MTLFDPFRLGDLSLPNRIVLAPMTRNRSPGQIVTPWAVEHYSLRAQAGLLISEATQISAQGQGSPDTPGIYSAEQIEAWTRVVTAVHAAGGRIVAQLSHAGRLSHSDYHQQPPVGPSPIPAPGFIRTPQGTKVYETPLGPSEREVGLLVDQFRRGAQGALDAGFDGVELHGAHGFLLDQFTQSKTNQRQDAYGGSTAKRLRFPLEVVEAVSTIWPKSRIGYTLSPGGNHKGIGDDHPVETFTELVRALDSAGIGWIHVADVPLGDIRPSTWLRREFSRAMIVSEGYTPESAVEALNEGHADLVAFGRAFTANPDLVQRLRQGQGLKHPDPRTFYTPGPEGYIAMT